MRLYLVASKHELYELSRKPQRLDEDGDWWTPDASAVLVLYGWEVHKFYGRVRLPKPGEVVVLDVKVSVAK